MMTWQFVAEQTIVTQRLICQFNLRADSELFFAFLKTGQTDNLRQ